MVASSTKFHLQVCDCILHMLDVLFNGRGARSKKTHGAEKPRNAHTTDGPRYASSVKSGATDTFGVGSSPPFAHVSLDGPEQPSASFVTRHDARNVPSPSRPAHVTKQGDYPFARK